MGPSFEKIMLYSLTLVTLAGVAGLTYSKKHVQYMCLFVMKQGDLQPINLNEGDNVSLFGFGKNSKSTPKE